MFKKIREDIESVFERDPAARNVLEVISCYPGFHAVLFYRVSNWFWVPKMYLFGRVISHIGRFLTGIEIHPVAIIGRKLFIDHGKAEEPKLRSYEDGKRRKVKGKK